MMLIAKMALIFPNSDSFSTGVIHVTAKKLLWTIKFEIFYKAQGQGRPDQCCEFAQFSPKKFYFCQNSNLEFGVIKYFSNIIF